MSLSASSSGSCRQPVLPSSEVLVCNTVAPIAARCARPVWRCCRSPPVRRCNCRCRARSRPVSGRSASRGPRRVARSSAGSRRSAASISSTVPSATDGALAPGMLATAIPSFGGGVHVDGVDPGAELVHQPQLRCAPQVRTGQWTQHVPDHLGVGQFAVRASSSSSAHHRMSSQSDSGATKIQHLLTGKEVRENSQRHRLAIHLAMVSACSLRAPGVVK